MSDERSSVQKRIDAAVLIVGKEHKARIAYAIGRVEKLKRKTNLYGLVRNKDQKVADRKFVVALKKLEDALKNPNLDQYIRDAFQLDEISFERWYRYCGDPERVLLARDMPHHLTGAKREAARAAVRLFVTAKIPIAVSKKSPLCRLAAALYGRDAQGKRVDLYEHCRHIVNEYRLKSVSKSD